MNMPTRAFGNCGALLTGIHFISHRYDKEGHAMDGQSLTELKGGSGGGNTNWKALSDVKTEHLGHADKVHTYSALP